MYAQKHPRVRKASRFVGIPVILGIAVALKAPIGTSPAQAATRSVRAHRVAAWTAYVANSRSGTVTPIDLATDTTSRPIPVGGSPSAIAITPNGATAYVVVSGGSEDTVIPINTATKTVGTPIPTGSVSCQGIAITPNGTTAYVVCAGHESHLGGSVPGGIISIDTATNAASTPVSDTNEPTSIAIAPNGASGYVADYGGSDILPFDTATNVAGSPIPDQYVGAGIAITPNGAALYVTNFAATQGGSTVTPIDSTTGTVGSPIPAANDSGSAVAITPNGATFYVTDNGTVTPIDIATKTADTPIVAGHDIQEGIAITPNGTTALVSNSGVTEGNSETNTVTPIDVGTNTLGTPITVGNGPIGIAITPDQAPVAHFSVTPTEAGMPTGFDASTSTVAVGTITTYAWDFGDGTTATTSTPITTHAYATPGPYSATVTETDSAGTSTTQVFTGQTMSDNGGPSAVTSQSFSVVPPLAIATSSLPGGSVWSRTNKVTSSATLAATGGNPPYKWSLATGSSPLPPGLKLKKLTGLVSGKATTAGTYSFTVQVVDTKMGKPKTQNAATATLSITIS